jgi:hypothetical protein
VGLSLCPAKRTQVAGRERGAVAIPYGHYGPLSGARRRWSDAAGTTDGPVFRHIWKAPDRDSRPAPPVISSQAVEGLPRRRRRWKWVAIG